MVESNYSREQSLPSLDFHRDIVGKLPSCSIQHTARLHSVLTEGHKRLLRVYIEECFNDAGAAVSDVAGNAFNDAGDAVFATSQADTDKFTQVEVPDISSDSQSLNDVFEQRHLR